MKHWERLISKAWAASSVDLEIRDASPYLCSYCVGSFVKQIADFGLFCGVLAWFYTLKTERRNFDTCELG